MRERCLKKNTAIRLYSCHASEPAHATSGGRLFHWIRPLIADGALYRASGARMAVGSSPFCSHHAAYAIGEISDGLISLRPPQKTFV